MNKLVKEYYSVGELSAMKLPGLAHTERNISATAKRMKWVSRERKARGGGYEYAFESLPLEAQQEIKCRAISDILGETITVVQTATAPATRNQLELPLTTRQQSVEGARKGVLLAIERMMLGCGVSRKSAMITLLNHAKRGELEPQMDAMLRAAKDGRGRHGTGKKYPSIHTLKSWLAQDKTGNLAPLPSKYKDMSVPVWAKDFLECYQRPEKPSVELAYRHF